MNGSHPVSDSASTPSEPSPISPSSSVPSEYSVSSSTARMLSMNPGYTTSQRPLPNLPPPPPPDRVPAPRGKSTQTPGHQKFKILRKGKDKEKSRGKVKIGGDGEDDDEWTLEGPVNGANSSSNVTYDQQRESLDLARPLGDDVEELFDSQMTEVPAVKEKKAKHRGLVKKTSRLFSRDKGHDEPSAMVTANGVSSNVSSNNSRQASFSSMSSDSQSGNGTSLKNHFSAFHRSSSNQCKNSSPPSAHSRRPSQESQRSWRPPSRNGRGGPSTTINSPPEQYRPVPQNRGSSHLSASVPALSRHALPQPVPVVPGSQETLPSRMSSWFSHLLPSSSMTMVSESGTSPETHQPPSPLRKPPSTAATLLNAARQKAVGSVRYLLDSEATPDKCEDKIWVLGVGHPGWRPSTPSPVEELPDVTDFSETRPGSGSSGKPSPPSKEPSSLRPPAWAARKQNQATGPTSPSKGFGQLFTGSTLSLALPAGLGSGSPSKDSEGKMIAESPSKGKRDKKEKEVVKWPEQFFDDFRSRIWFTYRSQYAPILSLPQGSLLPTPETYFAAFGPPADVAISLGSPVASSSLPSRPSASPWGWRQSAEERGLTSDAGWGCMLRTGQSMFANALIHYHLGRDWRLPMTKPPSHPETAQDLHELEDYALYVKVLSWFLDDPSPLAPFSVHRMALIGKELGKEVGEWFGPSTAAGALKTLANSFPLCGVSVATATDGIIYKSDVYNASNLPIDGWIESETASHRSKTSLANRTGKWGKKAVLILVGIRLGLDGVNPIYYESIKALFTFPQSVGIAGGRPSSSYYFVASQANSLFYLDPHFTRPAIPLEVPPAPVPIRRTSGELSPLAEIRNKSSQVSTEETEEVVVVEKSEAVGATGLSYTLDVVDVDDMSDDSDSSSLSSIKRSPPRVLPRSGFSRSTPPGSPTGLASTPDTPSTPIASSSRQTAQKIRSLSPSKEPSTPGSDPAATVRRPSPSSTSGSPRVSTSTAASIGPIDPSTIWYANAYSEAQLRTFHCERVRKLPLSGLDPSMLLGFLCRDEADFDDFCERVGKLQQKIFSVQDEPPSWDEEDDTGLESVSEPDLDGMSDTDARRSPSGAEPHGLNEDDEELMISANTTLEAVPVPSQSSGSVRLNDPTGTREQRNNRLPPAIGRVDTPEGEESWVDAEKTRYDPESFRSSTPSSLPVLIDKSELSQPSPPPQVRDNNDQTVESSVARQSKAYSRQDEAVETDMMGKLRINAQPKRPEARSRLDSWIEPPRGGQEAPNGDSIL